MKLLLNAEAFGFGPAASIAAIFEILRTTYPSIQIDYIGEKHTLDLQKRLSYNNIYEYINTEQLASLSEGYDFFITALDFDKAHIVKTKTIVYDTLLWFWPDTTQISKIDYYIAQDFFNVRFKAQTINCKKQFIVPPLLQKHEILQDIKAEMLLINFGGLENPYWDISTTVNYVQKILNSLIPVVSNFYSDIQIVCSKSHVPHIKNFDVRTATYQEMQYLLGYSRYVIATPGLGNIYELANYKKPSLFLPPVNDSQGQQLELMVKHKLIDNHLDWSLFQNAINYTNAQTNVLNDISEAITNMNTSKLSGLVENLIQKNGNLEMSQLFNLFGKDGKTELKKTLMEILAHVD